MFRAARGYGLGGGQIKNRRAGQGGRAGRPVGQGVGRSVDGWILDEGLGRAGVVGWGVDQLVRTGSGRGGRGRYLGPLAGCSGRHPTGLAGWWEFEKKSQVKTGRGRPVRQIWRPTSCSGRPRGGGPPPPRPGDMVKFSVGGGPVLDQLLQAVGGRPWEGREATNCSRRAGRSGGPYSVAS